MSKSPYSSGPLNGEPHTWETVKQNRRTYPVAKTNVMPPGIDIEQMNAFPSHPSASGGSTYTSQSVKAADLNSYVHLPQPDPTDPMYTNEDHTGFYETKDGFVERNNYLDRI